MVPPKDVFICVLVHPRKYFTVKLLTGGSLGEIIGHLVHHQVIFFVFSSMLDLTFVVQIVALTFLGCWALIIPTLITRF